MINVLVLIVSRGRRRAFHAQLLERQARSESYQYETLSAIETINGIVHRGTGRARRAARTRRRLRATHGASEWRAAAGAAAGADRRGAAARDRIPSGAPLAAERVALEPRRFRPHLSVAVLPL